MSYHSSWWENKKSQRNGHECGKITYGQKSHQFTMLGRRDQRIDYSHLEKHLLVCSGTLPISHQMTVELELSIINCFLSDPTSFKVEWVSPERTHGKMERVHSGLDVSRAGGHRRLPGRVAQTPCHHPPPLHCLFLRAHLWSRGSPCD